MSWSIAEVARMSKVTSRTLRHYHAIGLLRPAWTADGGRRHYEQEHLLRLQQILLLRRLGLGLDAIAEVLEAQSDVSTVEVLRRHRSRLLSERTRLGWLVETVDDTIESLEKGGEMAPEKLFEGFDPKEFGGFEPENYVDEARERWGDNVDQANAHVKNWTKDDWARFKDENVAVNERIAELFDAGVPARTSESSTPSTGTTGSSVRSGRRTVRPTSA